jgi:hypothetical protein
MSPNIPLPPIRIPSPNSPDHDKDKAYTSDGSDSQWRERSTARREDIAVEKKNKKIKEKN